MFTLFHVLVSLVSLGSGCAVLAGLLHGKLYKTTTDVFLISTILTNGTGFGFPFLGLLPSHIVAIISLVVLGLALYALYFKQLAGPWRRTYVGSVAMALWFNVFVLIVQLFRRIPAMAELAPMQNEPVFAVTQGLVFVAFAWLGARAAKRFTPS